MALQIKGEFGIIGISTNRDLQKMEPDEKKYDNQYLLDRQLEMLKLFYERNLLTKEQYDYEVEVLTTRIKTQKEDGQS